MTKDLNETRGKLVAKATTGLPFDQKSRKTRTYIGNSGIDNAHTILVFSLNCLKSVDNMTMNSKNQAIRS